MQNIKRPISGLLLFLICLGLPAQEKENKSLLRLDSKSEEFFITATRTKREADSLPGYVTVIDRYDIQRSNAQILPDLFKYMAGVEVRDNFGTARSTSIDIRGFGEVAGANTLILVDGRRLNRSCLLYTSPSPRD